MTPARAISGGIAATFLGIGLQRFAYSPLLPAMIDAHWLGPGAGGALGAANLGGYLFGALFAPAVGRAAGVRLALRAAALVEAVAFALCAWRGGLVWFLPWRVVAGFAGGVLMVLAGPAVQAVVPARMRGFAAGLTFMGVGLGIVAGAVAVPLLLPHGLAATWAALAAIAVLITILAWTAWPDVPPPPHRPGGWIGGRIGGRDGGEMLAAYALASVAATAHMLWWPDFIARGLGRGTAAGAAFWLLYGLAAVAGPALCGRLADRLGVAVALVVTLTAQAIALALPLALPPGAGASVALAASAVLAGATAIGTTGLVLTRAREIAGEGAPGLWSLASAAFGAAQTATGFLFAWMFVTLGGAAGGHRPLFGVSLAAGLGALALVVLSLRRSARQAA